MLLYPDDCHAQFLTIVPVVVEALRAVMAKAVVIACQQACHPQPVVHLLHEVTG